MAKRKANYLFPTHSFNLSGLPDDYKNLAPTSRDPNVMSCYNPIKTATYMLCSYTIQALLSYAQGANGDIGVVRISDGAYASQWDAGNDKKLVAYATKGGVLNAGYWNTLTDSIQPGDAIKGIGKADHNVNTAPLLLLYMLIEADINEANGATDHTITHALLKQAREAYEKTKTIPEDIVRLVCDDLFYALTEAEQPGNAGMELIPVPITSGSVALFPEEEIKNRAYAKCKVICGNPDILLQSNTAPDPGQTISTVAEAKALAKAYTDTLCWTEEEEAMIPQFPDDTEVPPEVATMLTRFLESRDWETPMNNPCWRGTTAYGKSTGVKILACILHTPLLWMTCATTTEIENFLSKYVPNTDGEEEAVELLGMPDLEDINCDPVYAYEQLTGEKKPSVTSEEVFKAYTMLVAAKAKSGPSFTDILKRIRKEMTVKTIFHNIFAMIAALAAYIRAIVSPMHKNPYKIVESDFVRALVRGYIVEVQEFSRIRDSGTLVGLNNFSEPGSSIPLVDGRHVQRHKNAMVVWTDNVGLASCRKVDASVLRRFSYILDRFTMPRERAVSRTMKNTGCADEDLVENMYDVWLAIEKFCKEKSITDEGVVSLAELESWVKLTMLEGKQSAWKICVETIVSKVTSDEEAQKEIQDGCLALEFPKAKLPVPKR